MAGKGNSIKTTRYGDFKGVDFSTDASLVDTYVIIYDTQGNLLWNDTYIK